MHHYLQLPQCHFPLLLRLFDVFSLLLDKILNYFDVFGWCKFPLAFSQFLWFNDVVVTTTADGNTPTTKYTGTKPTHQTTVFCWRVYTQNLYMYMYTQHLGCCSICQNHLTQTTVWPPCFLMFSGKIIRTSSSYAFEGSSQGWRPHSNLVTTRQNLLNTVSASLEMTGVQHQHKDAGVQLTSLFQESKLCQAQVL